MRLSARAKINWTLDITGKRADGYHLLDTLMQQVALSDEVCLEAGDGLTLSTEGGTWLPGGEDNLAVKAAKALQNAAGIDKGAAITLVKRIPVGAGLGGGSADAAAVLLGLNELWGLRFEKSALEEIGLTIGADVPYCIRGGLARARGIGEQITPLPCKRCYWLVIIQPCKGLSTKQVFAGFQMGGAAPEYRPDTQAALSALQTGNLTALSAAMGNVLQPVSQGLRPAILEAARELKAHKAQAAAMTGSGSAVFGVFWNAQQARKARESLRFKWPVCLMTHTVNANE